MPKHLYIGKQVEKLDGFVSTKVSFEDLVNSDKMTKIHKPNWQGSMEEKNRRNGRRIFKRFFTSQSKR